MLTGYMPVCSCAAQGLWLEGARWDRRAKTLKTALEDETTVPMPLLHFLPAQTAAAAACAELESLSSCEYECPLYKTSARQGIVSTTGQSSNYVLSVGLPAEGQSQHKWVLQGTCLLCQTDD